MCNAKLIALSDSASVWNWNLFYTYTLHQSMLSWCIYNNLVYMCGKSHTFSNSESVPMSTLQRLLIEAPLILKLMIIWWLQHRPGSIILVHSEESRENLIQFKVLKGCVDQMHSQWTLLSISDKYYDCLNVFLYFQRDYYVNNRISWHTHTFSMTASQNIPEMWRSYLQMQSQSQFQRDSHSLIPNLVYWTSDAWWLIELLFIIVDVSRSWLGVWQVFLAMVNSTSHNKNIQRNIFFFFRK